MAHTTAHKSSILLTGLLCSTALTVFSATKGHAEDDGVLSLDPIIVKQRDADGDAADRATAVYVADAEIERAAMGDLKDLFAGIASVSVGGAIPVAQKIYVNGIDMLKLAVQVDGVSQNNRVFHHASANAFDPGLMKSVRVDPGVAPADAGPGALAGRVVMETIDAEDILTEGQAIGGKTRLSYGENGDTFGTSLTLAGQSNGFEILLYGKRMTGDDYTDGAGNTVGGTRSDLTAGLLKLAYETDAGHRFEFSGQQMQDTALRNRRANFGTASFNPLGTVYDTKRTVYSLRYEDVNGGGNWDPSATIGFSENEIGSIGTTETSVGVTRTYSATFQNRFHLSESDTITAGIDFQDQKSSASGDYWGTNRPSETSQTIGVFAQARLQPSDRLKVSAGLRYDWNAFTGQDFGQIGRPYEQDSSGLSGNLSIVYDVNDALSLRAGYSNVFGGIGIEDNFLFFRDWDYSALKPRRASNVVVGADWQNGNWTLGAEAFQTKIDDTRDVAGPTVTSYDFESRGYNLGATYGWDSGFARLTFTDSETRVNGAATSSYYVLDSGAPIGQVLALEVQQELPQWDLVVGGHIDAAFDYDQQLNEADATTKLEGYEVLNLFAEYRPAAYDNVTIRAEINNVFDRQYADRATYGGDYPGFPTLKEPGRSVSLVANVSF
ncbi:TonB-dependent receptor plug domain-containing protein [Phaeobacter inhibens]|uniref:TonB-dependent receptor plug domain-containing protein n=1 Tax=Phaeobacter inhibens TaxID=221822 RepID=UPI0021A5F340|nr:TonB-dependent receptor [Phaeobacter inhibens]UWR47370.1 TonB-dependent receptor [Phaeobacter inhibens]